MRRMNVSKCLWLLPLVAGCALFRDPMTIPIDIEIRPHVGVELDTPGGDVSSSYIWVVAVVVVVGVWAYAHFGKKD